MLKSVALLCASLLAWSFTVPAVDEGQGTAQPGSKVSQLRPGTHVAGPRLVPSSLLGKVVVVKIGGS